MSTPQHSTENLERSAARRLLDLIDALPVPTLVHTIDPAGSIALVNRAFVDTYGYGTADLPTVAAFLAQAVPHHTDREALLAMWRDVARVGLASEQPCAELDFAMHDKTGHARHVHLTIVLSDDLAVLTVQETPPDRGEAMLETAYALTENMPGGAYTMILKPGEQLGHFAFVSRQFLEMLELTREKAVGDPTTGFSRVHPDDRPQWLALNVEAFTNRARFSGEARIIANGETRWIRAESVPRELPDGTLIWEGILVDITALKDAEHRLKSVIEAARAYTWRRDLRTGLIEYDEQWAALVGEAPGKRETPDDAWFDDVHPADVARVGEARHALESGRSEKRTLTYRRRIADGSWIWVQMHAGIGERDIHGAPTVLSGVTFDITEEVNRRQQAQEQLASLREDLQRAQLRDTLAEVAGGVIHDLNNLIAVISGTTEILQRRATGQPFFEDGLRRISGAVEMARALTDNLRRLSQRSKPRSALDLRTLLRDAVDLLGSQRLERHAVQLDVPDALVPVWSNPTEVVQVILNLAINACESGGADRTATVTLAALPPQSAPPEATPDLGRPPSTDRAMSLFTVSDTGAGITGDVRAQMFQPHFTTKGSGGTGLGLVIVSKVVQDNGAALWVDSTPGIGTTMTVAWPCSEARVDTMDKTQPRADDNVAGAAAHSPAQDRTLTGACIIVVDDIPDVAGVLAEMLEAADATVVTITEPEQAREFLAEAPGFWSLLVTDLHMAGLDGLALAAFASSLSPPVPTVLVTARAETLDDDATDQFAAILTKPVTMDRLVRCAAACISRT